MPASSTIKIAFYLTLGFRSNSRFQISKAPYDYTFLPFIAPNDSYSRLNSTQSIFLETNRALNPTTCPTTHTPFHPGPRTDAGCCWQWVKSQGSILFLRPQAQGQGWPPWQGGQEEQNTARVAPFDSLTPTPLLLHLHPLTRMVMAVVVPQSLRRGRWRGPP